LVWFGLVFGLEFGLLLVNPPLIIFFISFNYPGLSWFYLVVWVWEYGKYGQASDTIPRKNAKITSKKNKIWNFEKNI